MIECNYKQIKLNRLQQNLIKIRNKQPNTTQQNTTQRSATQRNTK